MADDRGVTVVLNPAGGESVHVARIAPPPHLQSSLSYLWVTAWDFEGRPPRVSQMLTDACVHVVVERGASRVAGVVTAQLRRELAGRGRIVAARFHPGAFRPWISRSVADLTDLMTPLRDVLPLDVADLEQRVLGADDDDVAGARLASGLADLAPEPDPTVERMRGAFERIEADPSLTRVDDLAEMFGTSARTLQRLFREYVGVAPKWAIRRARLLDAARQIQRGGETDVAALAAALGYFDQAHFTRDFKAVVGQPPATYARRLDAGDEC